MAIALAGSLVSEFILIILIVLVLYIIFKLGNTLLGLIINIVLGFIAIFVLNAIFNLGIPFDLVVVIITAILGLPGVVLVVLLKLIGISL